MVAAQGGENSAAEMIIQTTGVPLEFGKTVTATDFHGSTQIRKAKMEFGFSIGVGLIYVHL
jgi:hypothetical protein